jgi:hypothetical protein
MEVLHGPQIQPLKTFSSWQWSTTRLDVCLLQHSHASGLGGATALILFKAVIYSFLHCLQRES